MSAEEWRSAMVYEGNPKHKEPWQRGRRGSLCPPEVKELARSLLEWSELVGEKRYATYDGRAFCASEHQPGHWHGWLVGWVEVPEKLRRQWVEAGKVKRREILRYWDGEGE